MADETLRIGGLGTKAAPLDYTVTGDQEFTLLAVRATFDGTGAATSFLPTVQILDGGGNEMVFTQGSSVAAGGSADTAFFPLRTTTGPAVSPTFPQTVLYIGGAGTLRGYWRLGENASPFADTSGWSGGPTPMSVNAVGTAYTTHVTGALAADQDDGALQFNATPNNGYYLTNASAAINTGINTGFTVAGWVKPFASANNWIGAIYNNSTIVAGAPSHAEGWFLGVEWSGGNILARFFRYINNVAVHPGTLIAANTWSFLAATYDGATISLYVNGALGQAAADARADTQNPYSFPSICWQQTPNGSPVGQIYGVIDEVAIWQTVLSASQIATLYAAAFV